MIEIRQFTNSDLADIEEMDNMLWLQLQWNKAFHHEDAFAAVEDGIVAGAAALFYDGT